MSKHIALPWRVGVPNSDDVVPIFDANGDYVTDALGLTNASLIVRSVNAHSKLVEALEEARDYVADALHEQQTKARDRAAYPTIGARELIREKAIEDSMAKIDSALASAKGTTE
jgi:cellobiose-specific phosphotransferase system component IIA